MEASLEDRLAVASALILQSPPGEVNDVFNDVRPIVGDDGELERGLLPALAQYNTQQLTLVELPNQNIPAMICQASRVHHQPSSTENRYLDPHSQQTFSFDHLRLVASDLAPFSPPDPVQEAIRVEIQNEAESYVKNHFQNAVWSVFSIPNDHEQQQPIDLQKEIDLSSPVDDYQLGNDPVDPSSSDQPPLDHPDHQASNPIEQQPNSAHNQTSSSSQRFKLYIVGNKYNPTNYWTGRWRSIYDIDIGEGKIHGEIQVNVHYYEQGNVQLTTRHVPEIEISPSKSPSISKEIIKSIGTIEAQYQTGLNTVYAHLGDHTFKLLRRALPITKQKLNWNHLKSRIVLHDH